MYANQKGLRRHKNADIVTKTKLTFAEHATQSGICSNCNQCGLCEIGQKSRTGRTLFPEPFGISQFGAEKRIPSIDDIQILPELYGKGTYFSEVNTKTKLGGFESEVPIAVAAMGSTKVAYSKGDVLAAGAAKAGIVYVLGENILATYGTEGLKKRIESFLKNYNGKGGIVIQGNGHDIKAGVFKYAKEFGAHGIEIKLGQGAKQNLGGEIRFENKEEAEKYKNLGYLIKEKDGTFERHAFPGNITYDELKKTVENAMKYELKIWIKTGMGKGIVKLIEDIQKIKRETGANIEALTIDGFGGGTGMSPWLIMNETGIPSGALMKYLKGKKYDFDILLAGGFNNGIDIAKGLMLGANGISIGRAFNIAAKFGENSVVNFVNALKEELQMVATILRKEKVIEIIGMRENLYPISKEAAEIFGLEQTI